MQITGLTATLSRSDGGCVRAIRMLRTILSASWLAQVTPIPRTFVIDVAQKELNSVKMLAGDYDMAEVERS